VTDRFRVVPAAYVVLRRADQVLLQLRQGSNYMDGHWSMAAAGHVEVGESAFDAARREASEELGIAIKPDALRPLCAMHRTNGNSKEVDERVDFFFECSQWGGDPRLIETDKTADLRWFDLNALPRPIVPHELFVLKHLHDRNLPPLVAFGF